MIRVIVIGANGFIGSNFIDTAVRTTDIKIVGTINRNSIDLTDDDMERKLSEYYLKELTPDVCVVAAYNANVNYCEAHPDETAAVNVLAMKRIAEVTRAAGVRCIFLSSNYVYDDTGKLNPLNMYGMQKLHAETFFSKNDHSILRLQNVWGSNDPGLKNFYWRAMENVKRNEIAILPDDTPVAWTHVNAVVDAICYLVRGKGHKSIACASKQVFTREEFQEFVWMALNDSQDVDYTALREVAPKTFGQHVIRTTYNMNQGYDVGLADPAEVKYFVSCYLKRLIWEEVKNGHVT